MGNFFRLYVLLLFFLNLHAVWFSCDKLFQQVTLPKITDETGKVNSDQLRWNLYYQYYGGQALRGLWKQESVDNYNKDVNLWEGN